MQSQYGGYVIEGRGCTLQGSLLILTYRASTIWLRCRPEPMLTWICYMSRFAIIFLYRFNWSLMDKSVIISRASSRICEGTLVIIQVLSNLHVCLFISTGAWRMRGVCNRSCPKLACAFETVVWYTTLTLIHNMGRICLLYNMVCTLFWRVWIPVWKTLLVMMLLPTSIGYKFSL